jgi:ribonuclease-3
MELLESVISYIFRDRSLLVEALTHGSLGYECQRAQPDNQRLEFLGDAVIQLILSDILYHQYPHANEGLLTKVRAQLVSTKALAQIARKIQLGGYLLMGRGEESCGGRERDSTLADALESLTGAVYLDGGMLAAQEVARKLFRQQLEELGNSPADQNPKGQLQEMLQAISPQSPSYRILDESGPDHAKNFVAQVTWNGIDLGRGLGRSKKEAEVEAARTALESDQLKQQLAAMIPDSKATKNPVKVCE